MRPTVEGTAIAGCLGTVATPGTVTGTGVDWSPYYEPDAKLVLNVGASDGTVVAHFQGGTALASVYTSLGTITAAGVGAGTAVYELDVVNRYRYARSLITVAGGTAAVSSVIVTEPRTVT